MKIIDVPSLPFHTLGYRTSAYGGKVRKVELPFYKVRVENLPQGVNSIVAMSDLQGRETDETQNRLVGEAVANELNLLQEKGRIPSIDLALLAGDLYDFPDLRRMGGTGDVTSVLNTFADNIPHVVGVLGNHDLVRKNELKSNIQILDGKVEQVAGLSVGGVSGIIGKSKKNQRKTLAEFDVALKTIFSQHLNIALLHQGPNDPLNGQRGEPAIYDFLASNGNALVIFGHCHWRIPIVEIGNNTLLNVDNRVYVFHR